MSKTPEEQEQPIAAPLVQAVTVLELTPAHLKQIVAYSSSEAKAYTLGDYIVSHAPKIAKKFGLPLQTEGEQVKRVWQLTPEELRETVALRLRSGIAYKRLEINDRSYSVEDLATQVVDQTDVGKNMTRISRNSIYFLEEMIDAGKVKVRKKEGRSPRNITLPPFPF